MHGPETFFISHIRNLTRRIFSPDRHTVLLFSLPVILAVFLFYGIFLPLYGERGYGIPIPFWQQPLQVIILHTFHTLAPHLAQPLFVVLLLAVGLGSWFGFRQVEVNNVLDHPDRSRVYTIIRTRPGIYFRELERACGVNRGTLTYHLDILVRYNKIVTLVLPGSTHYFENSGKYTENEQLLLAGLADPRKGRILALLVDEPMTLSGLKRELGISAPATTWHLKKLTARGIVQVRKRDGDVRYFIDDDIRRLILALTGKNTD